MQRFNVKDLVFQTMIASIYVVLVYAFQFMSFGSVQFRIAEVLLIFVFFDKKSILGLAVGTFVANWLLSPFGIIDAVFGTIATGLALALMILTNKKPLIALSMPALANGFIIGYMIAYVEQIPFVPIFFWVFLGEFVVMYVLGLPLLHTLRKNQSFMEFFAPNQQK
jgi:uncharacterized membrane protein